VGAPYVLSARGVYADAASGTIVKSVQPEQLPLGERTTVIIDAEHLDQILSAELVPSTGVSVADVKCLEKAKRGGSRWSVAITVDRDAPTGDRRLVLVTPGGRAEWVLRIPSHVPMISRMSILTLESNPIAVNILFLVTDSAGDLSPQESLRVRIGFESSGGVLWSEQPPDDTTLLAAGRLRVRKAVEFKEEGLSFSGKGQALLSVGFWDREGNRSAEYKVPVQFPGSKQVRQIPPADLVAGLSDAQLAERAENDIFSEVRRAAVSKLTDTRLLARIAKEDIVDYVRQAAIAQITDQAVLGEIARTSPHWQDRSDVVKKLGDSPLLWEIAKSDPDSDVRLFALKKVTNQITLYEAVKGDPVSGNREAALERIKDPAMLSVIATTNPEDRIRWIATRRVVDQDVLIRIAKTDPWSLVREEAAYRVSNQESRLEILRTETEENVRLAAAKRQDVAQDKNKLAWTKDLRLRINFTYERGTWMFSCTVTNNSTSVAYQNLKYKIAWFGGTTEEEKTASGVIQPGKTIEFSESRPGPSPFGKMKGNIGGGMILVSKEKDSVVGIAINEDQIDESIRTRIRIVSAEPKPAPPLAEPPKNDH
jgi:hypothetical protein